MDRKPKKSKNKTGNKVLRSKPSKKHVSKGPTVLKSKVKKTPPMHPPRQIKNYLKPLDPKSGPGRYADQKIDELTKQAEIEKEASLARMTPGPSRNQMVKMVEETKAKSSVSIMGQDAQIPEIPSEEEQEEVEQPVVEGPPSETSVLDQNVEEIEEVEDIEESEPEDSSSKVSLPDVEGGLPKHDLKRMKITELREILRSIEEEMKFVETENYVLQRSLDKLEVRDKEIESDLPTFEYRLPWDKGSNKNSMNKMEKDDCQPSESEGGSDEKQTPTAATEEKQTPPEEFKGYDEKGYYKPIKFTIEDIFPPNSNEAYENMTDEEKEDIKAFIKSLGPMPPRDFDIFRHTYGNLIYTSSDEEGYDTDPNNIISTPKPNTAGESEASDQSYSINNDIDPRLESTLTTPAASNSVLDNKIRESSQGLENSSIFEQHQGTLVGTDSKISELRETEHQRYLSTGQSDVNLDDDDDEDFPGFKILSAQKLPQAEKLMYSLKILDDIQIDYSMLEKDCQLKETLIQVFIDTSMYAYELLRKFQEDFNELKKNSKIHRRGYYMAERFKRFVKRLQGRILDEVTKVNMTLSEVSKVKKKIEAQLDRNKEMGESIELIDYQWLKISISQYSTSIEEKNLELNELKLLTTHCFQVLKEWRDKLNKSVTSQVRIRDELEARNNLMESFDNDGENLKNAAQVQVEQNKLLRRKLRAFRAPNTMDYVKLKVLQYGYKDESEILQKKINFINGRLRKLRLKYQKFNQGLEEMTKEDCAHENECWLDEIKNDMSTKGIDCYLETMSEEQFNCGGGSNHGFKKGRNKDFNPLREYSKYKKDKLKETLLTSNRRSQIFSRTAKYSNILLDVKPLTALAANYTLFLDNKL